MIERFQEHTFVSRRYIYWSDRGIVATFVIELIFDFGWALAQRVWTHQEEGRLTHALADLAAPYILNRETSRRSQVERNCIDF